MTSGGGAGTQSQDLVAEVPEPSARLSAELSGRPSVIVPNQVAAGSCQFVKGKPG